MELIDISKKNNGLLSLQMQSVSLFERKSFKLFIKDNSKDIPKVLIILAQLNKYNK
jgi:NADPH-dependent 7-cyano-7-deazaguanine reductase QueF-like protein